jgi:predicted Zn-dependent peptidase
MFRKENLANGVPVVTETLKNMRSVVLGIWVKVGSRYEPHEKNGISHFLEHMFFKGTKKRSAKDIALEIDSLGGELNAFTSRETTTFYVKVLDDYIEKGLELLSDIFINSTFPEEDIEKEKRIVKEEIKMVEDTPDEYVHDLSNQTIWGRSGLGQPVLGRRDSIKLFSRDDLTAHIKIRLSPAREISIPNACFLCSTKLSVICGGGLSLKWGRLPSFRAGPIFSAKSSPRPIYV